MDALLQAMRNLGPSRLAIMGGVVLSMVFFFIYITSRIAQPSLDLLYADLSPKDSGKITQILDTMKIPFEIGAGSSISIPGEEIPRVRLLLADQGIPGGGTLGYEIFDEAEGLGTTNFTQNVNLVRALEGELSRSIQSISIISSVRVHLVLPKRQLFSRERQEPSASIILNMSGNKRLANEQVQAIQHLVATAVPDLKPNRVSITDNKGKLLASGFEDENDISVMAEKTTQRQRIFERRMARTIEELLERTIGSGKVQAQVNAELDFDRINTEEEIFDPDGQVVRSTQSSEQNSSALDSEGATPVGVGTNLPDPGIGAQEGVSSSANDATITETVNFEISKKVVNHIREVGTVRRLSVAVLVDGEHSKNADGERIYEERSERDMELLATLVRGAIGFNADRGDVIEMINMEFAGFIEEDIELELFFGMDKNDLLRIAEFLVLGIVAILVILLVVRPLISRAIESIPSADALAAERLIADQTAAAALTAPGGAPIPGETLDGDVEQFEELIDIDRVEGRVKASSVKKVGEIVEKHPDEALSIVRNWMYAEK